MRLYWLSGDARLAQSIVWAATWMERAAFVPADHPANVEGGDAFWYICRASDNSEVYPALNPMDFAALGFAYQQTGDARFLTLAQRLLSANMWGRSIKEYNQALRTAAQGLYLLSKAPGSVALTLGQGTQTPAPAPTYTVSGRITSGGSPLSGVSVRCGGAAATSAGDGSYTLAGLAAGTYAVSVTHPGYSFSGPGQVSVGSSRSGVDYVGTVSSVAPTGGLIYDEGLAAGWSSSGSRSQYRLDNGTPVKSGGKSLALTITGNDGAVQLSGPKLPLAGRSVLRMWVHGGKSGGQQLRARALIDGKLASGSVNLRNYGGLPRANGWIEYSVPLADLGAAGGNLTALRIFAGSRTSAAYLDLIRVE
jgi:hypothetical protein